MNCWNFFFLKSRKIDTQTHRKCFKKIFQTYPVKILSDPVHVMRSLYVSILLWYAMMFAVFTSKLFPSFLLPPPPPTLPSELFIFSNNIITVYLLKSLIAILLYMHNKLMYLIQDKYLLFLLYSIFPETLSLFCCYPISLLCM